jgi:biotin carboxylase
MADARPPTILCLASYFKGTTFLEACAQHGAHVILVTKDTLADAAWPRSSIAEFFTMPDPARQPDITHAVSYLARTRMIDLIVPLDEYDATTAASLREHLRLPGLGESAVRYVRDKLAMRVKAQVAGLTVPDFVHVLNYERLRAFLDRVPPPWLLKPRSEAATMGIKRLARAEDLWSWLEHAGDEQSFYLLEHFIPGDVYHVDSIIANGQVMFATVHQYAQPPLDVVHGGGVFASQTVPAATPLATRLLDLNRRLIHAFALHQGVTHAEFIHTSGSDDLFFLEIAARVGGAYIDQLVERATGINLWAEWARVELSALRGVPYQLPPQRHEYAGLVLCLARQAAPDLSSYQDPEIVWRLDKPQHAGLIVAAPNPTRVSALIDGYRQRFATDFLAFEAPLDRPPP